MKKIVVFLCTFLCAVQLFAQTPVEARNVINSLMPYIKAEIKGTQAEADINAFYASAEFKKSGAEPYKVLWVDDKSAPGVSAYFNRFDKKIYINNKFIEETLKLDLRLPLEGFSKDPAKMARLAVVLAPIFVHEFIHQQEDLDMKAMGITNVPTRQSEYLAHFAQYVFMAEKQLSKGKNYYDFCPDLHGVLILVGDRMGAQGLMQIVAKVYTKNPQVFAPFDREHIVLLIGSLLNTYGQDPVQMEKTREAAFQKDLTALGILKPDEKVLITVNDYLSTGKYNWNRITLSELETAYNGKNVLFNKYTGWFETKTKNLIQKIDDIRKRKQVKNYLASQDLTMPAPMQSEAKQFI